MYKCSICLTKVCRRQSCRPWGHEWDVHCPICHDNTTARERNMWWQKRSAEARLDEAYEKLKFKKDSMTAQEIEIANRQWQLESDLLRDLQDDHAHVQLFKVTPLHKGLEKLKRSQEPTPIQHNQPGTSSGSALEAPRVPLNQDPRGGCTE